MLFSVWQCARQNSNIITMRCSVYTYIYEHFDYEHFVLLHRNNILQIQGVYKMLTVKNIRFLWYTFIASHFSKNQKILCKVATAIIEKVFSYMLSAKSQCSQNQQAYDAHNVKPDMRVLISYPSITQILNIRVMYLFVWNVLNEHYKRIFKSVTFFWYTLYLVLD